MSKRRKTIFFATSAIALSVLAVSKTPAQPGGYGCNPTYPCGNFTCITPCYDHCNNDCTNKVTCQDWCDSCSLRNCDVTPGGGGGN